MTDPHIEVTPWSKTPLKVFEPVDVEMHAVFEPPSVVMLLTKSNGWSMAIGLTAEGMEILYKNLSDIRRRFKAHKEETP